MKIPALLVFATSLSVVVSGQDTIRGSRHVNQSTISTAEWISIFSSVAMLITVVVYYLLLRETQKTLKLGLKVFEQDKKRMEVDTINTISQNFRNTYMAMLNDPEILTTLTEAEQIDSKAIKIRLHSSFLLNNVHEIYNLGKRNFLSPEDWNSMVADMKNLFDYPFIKKRWEQSGHYYSKDFQNFINSDIIPPTDGGQE